MNEILKMLKGLDVEYKRLGEVCDKILAGGDVPKNYKKGQLHPTEEFPYPIYSNGTNENSLYGYTDEYKIDKDAVTISARGTIGWHTTRKAKFTPIVRLITLIPDQKIITTKYLNYVLDVIEINSSGGSIPQLTIPMVNNLTIPIPPIPIQEEIVRILDAFTNSHTELQKQLQTELELRKKQYNYYRDKLLCFEDINGGGGLDVEYKRLGEISTIKTGKSNSQDAIPNGIYPLFDRSQTIKRSNRFLFDDEAIIIAGEGNFTPKYFSGKFDLHQRAYAIHEIKQAIPKFIFYAILSNEKYFKRVAVDSTITSLRVKHLQDFPIPLPPLEEQKRIVEILDKFDKLVNDISIGIPAEIDMRKKQYEYYRDELLRFEAG